MSKPKLGWVPFTAAVPVSRRRPAPKQEPLSSRRTRIKLLARTLLDAIDRHERTQNGKTSNDDQPSLWTLGNYAELLQCLDELRSSPGSRRRGICDCFWAVYVRSEERRVGKECR